MLRLISCRSRIFFNPAMRAQRDINVKNNNIRLPVLSYLMMMYLFYCQYPTPERQVEAAQHISLMQHIDRLRTLSLTSVISELVVATLVLAYSKTACA